MTNELIKFAAGDTSFYEGVVSYFTGNRDSAKKELVDKAFFAEVEKMSGVSSEGMDASVWAHHPLVVHASLAIYNAAVNAIIPETIVPQVRDWCDFAPLGYGDVKHITIAPNQLYTVTDSATGARTVVRQRKFKKDVQINPVDHAITGYDDWYRILANKSGFADSIAFMVLSMETKMYTDALNAFTSGLAAQSAPWKKTGSFDLGELLKLCETVQAKNGNIKPIICGSATALLNVLPDAANGFRVNLDGKDAAIELVKTAFGFPVVKLDNAIDANDNLILPTNKLFVVCPGADKLVKGAVTTALSNGNDAFMNADLTKDFTYHKAWDFVFASAAKGAIYEIQ